MRAGRIHLAVLDTKKSGQGRKREPCRYKENGLRGNKVTGRAHDHGGGAISGRSKTRIASEARGQRIPPYEAEAYGGDRGRKHRGCGGL